MEDRNKDQGQQQQQQGTQIDRDEYGRSDAQQSQQGDFDGGRQMGTGNEESPSGGYGLGENQQHHQGQQRQMDQADDPTQSRGERHDEQQGGRNDQSLGGDLSQGEARPEDSEWDQQQGEIGEGQQGNQRAFQDRGQGEMSPDDVDDLS